jgi:hypothetical protein
VLWGTSPALQSGSGIAPIIARDASALARILIGRSDAAAGIHALAIGLCAYVNVILGALDTFFLSEPDIH